MCHLSSLLLPPRPHVRVTQLCQSPGVLLVTTRFTLPTQSFLDLWLLPANSHFLCFLLNPFTHLPCLLCSCLGFCHPSSPRRQRPGKGFLQASLPAVLFPVPGTVWGAETPEQILAHGSSWMWGGLPCTLRPFPSPIPQTQAEVEQERLRKMAFLCYLCRSFLAE